MLDINLKPFPHFHTDRLILRAITVSDTYDFFLLQSNQEVMKHIALPMNTMKEAEQKLQFLADLLQKKEAINWAITQKENDKLIGIILLKAIDCKNHRAEVGYMLHPDFWQKGIVQEALKTILYFAFHTLNFHSLEAIIDPENTASKNVLERNGFVKEAHFKENYFLGGQFLDSAVYSLLKSNYVMTYCMRQPKHTV
jgi:ribosomal-protein-alanine N-acetyltransferase